MCVNFEKENVLIQMCNLLLTEVKSLGMDTDDKELAGEPR